MSIELFLNSTISTLTGTKTHFYFMHIKKIILKLVENKNLATKQAVEEHYYYYISFPCEKLQ